MVNGCQKRLVLPISTEESFETTFTETNTNRGAHKVNREGDVTSKRLRPYKSEKILGLKSTKLPDSRPENLKMYSSSSV